ncbi:MAG: cbb3-type cytochrome c oxidase subunit I [Jiangellaceae bacterium]
MTVTESPAEAPAEAVADESSPVARPAGLAGLLGTGDHISVGRLWVVASLLFLLAAGVAGGVIGAERLDTGSLDVLNDETQLGQVFTLHSTAAVFLFLVPLFIGIATAVVPLQVGAGSVAFPRASAAAFWGWFLSGGVLLASYLADGGPNGTDRDGVLLWIVGLGGVLVSLCLGTVCVVTTVWALRTAGMTLDRVSAFSWSMLVAGTIWLLSLPVAFGLLILAWLDVRYGSGILDGGVYGDLRWAIGQPQVYAYALPALGLLLDAVPVAAGVRPRNYGVLLGAVAFAGITGYGAAWLNQASDSSLATDASYVIVAFAVLLPLLIVFGGVADVLRRGLRGRNAVDRRLRLTSPLLFGIGGLLLFLAAAAAGAARTIDPLELVGTTADSAVVHGALLAGAIGGLGALHHWSTKLFGVQLKESIGRLAALVLLLGGLALAVPDFVSGLLDQPVGSTAPDVQDGVEALNGVSLAGGALVLLGVLLVLLNLAASAARRKAGDVPADPWDGHTLEWLTTSPPAPGNFGPVEPVTSAAPLLDQKEASS